jgi:glycosyltransferase involved in cell wall biosynthesis
MTREGPPVVDVVIPAYNSAATLNAAIESVFAQTYRDFRIIVVDDGSTDETQRVLAHYADRCICLQQANAGAAAARNRGISAGTGEYVAFLDADDLWYAEKLAQQIAVLSSKPETGLVCSDFAIEGGSWATASQFSRIFVPDDGHMFAELVKECIIFTSTVLVRRRVLEDVGLFNESLPICEDMNLWLRVAARYDVAAVREVLVTRRNRKGSLYDVHANTAMSLRCGLAAHEDVEAHGPQLAPRDARALRAALAKFYYRVGSAALTTGDRAAARTSLKRARQCGGGGVALWAKSVLALLPLPVFRTCSTLHYLIFRQQTVLPQ